MHMHVHVYIFAYDAIISYYIVSTHVHNMKYIPTYNAYINIIIKMYLINSII